MGWLHKQELRAAGIDPDKRDEEDDGTPRWEIEQDGGGNWDAESHTRPRDD